VIHHSDQGSQGGFKCSSQHDLSPGITGSTPFGGAVFRRCWWPTLAKHSVVLGLVQDEPALRAGAASGILDKTCARRSARGRSAPRNGPFDPTKECDLDLGSGQPASEADNASS
jgi:hypothetical protein